MLFKPIAGRLTAKVTDPFREKVEVEMDEDPQCYSYPEYPMIANVADTFKENVEMELETDEDLQRCN